MSLSHQTKNNILRSLRSGLNHQQTCELVGVSRNTINKLLKTRKRVMSITDIHGGHVAGLTPPDYQKYNIGMKKFEDQQHEAWAWYDRVCKILKPNVLFVTGDMTEGKGKRSGGSELITTLWEKQCDIAYQVIKTTGAKEIVAVYGTPCHTGDEDDYENFIIGRLKSDGIRCRISGHEFPRVHQIQFDLKHKIGSSAIPHGRATAIMKSKLWNIMWAERNQQPDSDVLLRGHVHYFNYVGNSRWLGIVQPALQGWGSKYGIRQCEGIVDFGLIWFDVYDGDTLDTLQWHYEIPQLESHKVKIAQL